MREKGNDRAILEMILKQSGDKKTTGTFKRNYWKMGITRETCTQFFFFFFPSSPLALASSILHSDNHVLWRVILKPHSYKTKKSCFSSFILLICDSGNYFVFCSRGIYPVYLTTLWNWSRFDFFCFFEIAFWTIPCKGLKKWYFQQALVCRIPHFTTRPQLLDRCDLTGCK